MISREHLKTLLTALHIDIDNEPRLLSVELMIRSDRATLKLQRTLPFDRTATDADFEALFEKFDLVPAVKPGTPPPFDLAYNVDMAHACVMSSINADHKRHRAEFQVSTAKRLDELQRQWANEDRKRVEAQRRAAHHAGRWVPGEICDFMPRGVSFARSMPVFVVEANALRNAIKTAAGVALFVFALGWLGPSLESTPTPLPITSEDRDQLAWLDAEARSRCAAPGLKPGDYLPTADGGIVCGQRGGATR